MRMRNRGVWSWLPAATLGLSLGLGAGGAGAEIYAWRLDDGGYAFTDDEKAIPARYRDRVEVRAASSLRHYERYTPKDDRATENYAQRVSKRLESLRRMNAVVAPGRVRELLRVADGRGQVRVRSGRDGASVEVMSDATGEPVVVETLLMRSEGSAVAQPVRVTRRGRQVLAIEKPRKRQWNLLTDVYDEAELREAME